MPQAIKEFITFSKTAVKVKGLKKGTNINTVYPIESKTGLEYLVFLGRKYLHPQAKEYRFSRKDTLRRHFDNIHKPPAFFGTPNRPCDWPGCFFPFVLLPRYMSHLAKVHKISL